MIECRRLLAMCQARPNFVKLRWSSCEKKVYPNGYNPAIIAPTRRAWHVYRHGACHSLGDMTASLASCVGSHSMMQVSRVGITCTPWSQGSRCKSGAAPQL